MIGNDHFIAKTFQGLEPLLAEELRALGATDIQPGKRMIRFHGDQNTLYKSNLYSRTALRILVPVGAFTAHDEHDLYEGIRRIRWREHMRLTDTFAVDSVVYSHLFRHSQYVALKTKDAIVDQFRERSGERPSVDTQRPRIRIHVHIAGDQVSVYLDSSGESLHRRGYRQSQHPAPISEVLAAGLVLLSGWRADAPFLDPMCGSGTIAIEAAMIAKQQAPGLGRRFGFETWPGFNRKDWDVLLEEAQLRVQPAQVPIFASDHDHRAIEEATDHLRQAGCEREVQLRQISWNQLLAPAESGTLLLNPPYGERMPVADIDDLYRSIGDRMKRHFAGWSGWIISANMEAMKKIGLKPDRKFNLFNGPLPCKFLGYDLYAGSREGGSPAAAM